MKLTLLFPFSQYNLFTNVTFFSTPMQRIVSTLLSPLKIVQPKNDNQCRFYDNYRCFDQCNDSFNLLSALKTVNEICVILIILIMTKTIDRIEVNVAIRGITFTLYTSVYIINVNFFNLTMFKGTKNKLTQNL